MGTPARSAHPDDRHSVGHDVSDGSLLIARHERRWGGPMGWPEAHRYYAALRAVEEELDRTGDGVLPWQADYAEIFGDRHGLLLALWRRWQVLVQAQVERPYDEDGRPTAELRELADAHPGLVGVVERHTGDDRDAVGNESPIRQRVCLGARMTRRVA